MSLAINCSATPSNFIANAVDWLKRGDRIALITLVSIEGSAPYPIGSQMLVNQDGEYRGQITGGCAELALVDQAVGLISKKRNETHRYGLDSLFFDIQLPCGSGIDVYFDVTTTLSTFINLNDQLRARHSVQQTLSTSLGQVTKLYRPNERLIVFGQGPILIRLCQIARLTGFEVLCIVQDQLSLSQLSGLDIKAVAVQEGQSEFMSYCDEYTALVSLFHEHDFETDILTFALTTPLFYIGALGSRKTHAARLKSLELNGVLNSTLSRIFAPVGIDIKAQTPAQIAISVLAQIIDQMPKWDD